MELGDLISELRENILHDRSDRISGDPDQLWSDATLVRYIDEAQRRFARKSLVIRDNFTSCATDVTLVDGQTEYKLHDSVLGVVSAKYSDDPGDLIRVGHSYLNTFDNNTDSYASPVVFGQLPAGKPVAYGTDESVGEDNNITISAVTLRVYPTPSAAYDGSLVKLRVVRMPMERLTARNLHAIPEIPEAHHLEMLDWAAYLALRMVDRDSEDIGRAKDFAASFESHVLEARKEVLRKMFVPTRYGFGRGGWAWES